MYGWKGERRDVRPDIWCWSAMIACLPAGFQCSVLGCLCSCSFHLLKDREPLSLASRLPVSPHLSRPLLYAHSLLQSTERTQRAAMR